MDDELVPEMHDIGKLVDKSIINEEEHIFLNIDDFKNKIEDNKNWFGIKHPTGQEDPKGT